MNEYTEPEDPRRAWAESSIAHYISLLDDPDSDLRQWVFSHEQLQVIFDMFVSSAERAVDEYGHPSHKYRVLATCLVLGYLVGFSDHDAGVRMITRQDPDVPVESAVNPILTDLYMPYKTEWECAGGSGLTPGKQYSK